MNILIPGAGGFASINAIKSLRKINCNGKLVTIDSNPLSAGFYLADAYYVVPKAHHENYIEAIKKIIVDENISLILPTSGFDIFPISKHESELKELGALPYMCDYKTMCICNNKLKFYKKLKDDFDLPYTTTSSINVKFPIFIKPIYGKGSRNTFLCINENELSQVLENKQDMIFQEYLPGEEYTIDTLSDLRGGFVFASPRIRLAVKDGISFKGKVIKDEEIFKECRRLCSFLNIKGPSCIQMKRDVNGKLKILEVNPRMGGGTIFTTLAGFNIPALIVSLVNGEKIEKPEISEITILRYYEEVVMEDSK